MTLRTIIILGTMCLGGTQIGSGLAWLAASQLPVDRGARPLPTLDLIDHRPVASVLAGHLFAPFDDPPEPLPPDGPEVRCDDRWRMVGSWIDRRVPERSFASVHTPDGGRLIAVGQTFAGFTVVNLIPNALTLEREDGARCRVGMHDDAIATLPEESPPPRRGTTRATSSHVEVDLEQIGALPRRLRALPHLVDGHIVGVRLYGIHAGDAIHAAGARSGDLVRAIDGEPLSDPNVALSAYGRLRSGEPVRVTIERGGETIEITVQASD